MVTDQEIVGPSMNPLIWGNGTHGVSNYFDGSDLAVCVAELQNWL